MSEERPRAEEGRRPGPRPVLAGALGAGLLLLLCWPFVQAPPPTLPAAFLHVFACWAAALPLLWWISRGFEDGEGTGDGDRDG